MLVLQKWDGIKSCAKARAACQCRPLRYTPRGRRAIVREHRIAADYNETYPIIVISSSTTRELMTRFDELKDISYQAIGKSE
jgi:hypothetical protein